MTTHGSLLGSDGMYASMEAELEIQRTIKRAELTVFVCLLKKVIGPKEYLMDYEKERKSVSSQEQEMQLAKGRWERKRREGGESQ